MEHADGRALSVVRAGACHPGGVTPVQVSMATSRMRQHLAVLAVMLAVLGAPVVEAMQRGGLGLRRPGRQVREQPDQPRRLQGQLQVGDLATDFTLAPRDGGEPVTLSSFRGRSPVALVFGSYT